MEPYSSYAVRKSQTAAALIIVRKCYKFGGQPPWQAQDGFNSPAAHPIMVSFN
jgi:hypothetical protein